MRLWRLSQPDALSLELSFTGLLVGILVPFGSFIAVPFAGAAYYFFVRGLNLPKIVLGALEPQENHLAAKTSAISFSYMALAMLIIVLVASGPQPVPVLGDTFHPAVLVVGFVALVFSMWKAVFARLDLRRSIVHKVFMSGLEADARFTYDRALDLWIILSLFVGLGFSNFIALAAFGFAVFGALRTLGKVALPSNIIALVKRTGERTGEFKGSLWLNILDAGRYPSGYLHSSFILWVGMLLAVNLPFVTVVPLQIGWIGWDAMFTLLILAGLIVWGLLIIRYRIEWWGASTVPVLLGLATLTAHAFSSIYAMPFVFPAINLGLETGFPSDTLRQIILGSMGAMGLFWFLGALTFLPRIEIAKSEFRRDYGQVQIWTRRATIIDMAVVLAWSFSVVALLYFTSNVLWEGVLAIGVIVSVFSVVLFPYSAKYALQVATQRILPLSWERPFPLAPGERVLGQERARNRVLTLTTQRIVHTRDREPPSSQVVFEASLRKIERVWRRGIFSREICLEEKSLDLPDGPERCTDRGYRFSKDWPTAISMTRLALHD